MRKFFIFFPILLWAQTPPQICQIKDFHPTAPPGTYKVLSISLGTYGVDVERCTFWFNSPTPGLTQLACYDPNDPLNPNPVRNEIASIKNGGEDYWSFGDGSMTWIITPGRFHLAGAGSDQLETKLDGTF